MPLMDDEQDLRSWLNANDFVDPDRALRLFSELARSGVNDDALADLRPMLLQALEESSDPERALACFARWFAVVGTPASYLQTLLQHPVGLRLLCLVLGASQYFADLLTRHPEYFEVVANPGVRGGAKTAGRLLQEVSGLIAACSRTELKRDALRRWKAREMLRIGVRDLAGLADMPSTAYEFSNLAAACVAAAVEIARSAAPPLHNEAFWSPMPISIIAMGKLGGRELNYSSDIDLIFVSKDDLPDELTLQSGRSVETAVYLIRFAETVVKVLAEDTTNGHVFRVDMRLRPEGRFGPLVRSLRSCATYYESWAETWEWQALIKARPIAGDPDLGAQFLRMVEPNVYRMHPPVSLVVETRENKRRIEEKTRREGEEETNVKTGRGGIRDVEFIVQLLQMRYGGVNPSVRTGNSLTALRRLRRAGYLPAAAAEELAESYQFLRTLEHRLQLLHGFQTQTMPPYEDARERAVLARRMGFENRDAFEQALERHRDRVAAHLADLFYADDADAPEPNALTLSERGGFPPDPPVFDDGGVWFDIERLLDDIDTPGGDKELGRRLHDGGFTDIAAALRACGLAMRGNEFGGMPPDTPLAFKRVARSLLTLCARSANADNALSGIEVLALASPNRAQLYASLANSPDALQKLVALSASAPPMITRLARRPEWIDTLLSEEVCAERLASGPPEDVSEARVTLVAEFAGRVGAVADPQAQLQQVAHLFQRETLLIAGCDVWEVNTADETMRRLTILGEAVLETLLAITGERLARESKDAQAARSVLSRVAIVALGKLGGAEPGYSSDWDLVFAYPEGAVADESDSERYGLVSGLVEAVQAAAHSLANMGAPIEIDLRLRPWGRKGAMALTPAAYTQYFVQSAETWERQMALKARVVAGDRSLGGAVAKLFRAESFGKGVSDTQAAEIRDMKRRIETERLRLDRRHTDLKLGHGGLSDIEWLVQLLQLRHGASHPEICSGNTVEALVAIEKAQLLPVAEAVLLRETYRMLYRVRNAIWLLTGKNDTLAADSGVRRTIARRFGYTDNLLTAERQLESDITTRMADARLIFEARFGASPGISRTSPPVV